MITKRIRIVHDNDYEWDDDYCVIAYSKNNRYVTGTKGLTPIEESDLRRRIDNKEVIALPVYAYIHGGIVLSTTPFNDPWDSGLCGVVYSEFPDATEDDLRSYVGEFNKYLAGDTWGLVAEEAITLTGKNPLTGEPIERVEWIECDSCYGFLGNDPETNGRKEQVEELLENGFVFTDEAGRPL